MHQDVIIIGGSFAGLSAAMQLARGQRLVTVIDANKPRNRFSPESHGFFCLDGESPAQIREKAIHQLKQYPTVTFIEGSVIHAQRLASDFAVTLENKEVLHSAKLILATGLRDELPAIPGIQERWGKTVIHCPYCHGYELANQPLGVIATSTMSAHQAGLIPDWGPTTYFTQGQYFPEGEQRAFLKKRGVVIEESPVIRILGESPALNGVELADGRILEMAGVYIAPKLHMASELALSLGCEFEEGALSHVIKTDDFKQTTVPGVYAAGDMANPMQNATLASTSGMLAGVGAHHALMQN